MLVQPQLSCINPSCTTSTACPSHHKGLYIYTISESRSQEDYQVKDIEAYVTTYNHVDGKTRAWVQLAHDVTIEYEDLRNGEIETSRCR